MSEERKTKTDAAAPASAALERIDRKDAFLQALHTFLTAHQGTEWAVAAVDIQHFKLYNELYGTEKGDVLLETMANCLLGYSKQTGYPVGYFGNDDFFLCLPDEKAEQTVVLATLQACMAAGRQDVTFFVVMGVCPVQANPGADAATLCNYAQIAGVTTDSGYLHRFEPTMLNELKEQQLLLGELERALDNHEFCFFLQPKCNSITRAIVGMEALVRWNHPTRGCVPPAEFMPLLERTGLVTRLDQYIWESVCQTLQKWQESGSNLVPVSVNVSVQDILNLDVPQIFADLVEKYKLEPKLLLAEITETMVAEDTQMVENAIQGLHRKGFSVMMDDFGSGYSSLNMLKDTNVDAIKLGLIKRVIVYKLDRISRSIVDFAKLMELFKQYNVEFVSCTEKFDTSTPMGRAMLNICIVFAQLERESIQMRVQDAFYSRCTKGYYMRGRTPYGFDTEPIVMDGIKTKKLVENAEMDFAELMFQMYAEPGNSYGDITRYFVKHSIKVYDKALQRAFISKLLRNPVYVQADMDIYEYFKAQGVKIESTPEMFTGDNSCYLYQGREGEEQILVIAPHQGRISSQLWLTVQRKLSQNTSFQNGRKCHNTWLAGKIKCGRCGYALTALRAQNGVTYLRCKQRADNGSCEGAGTLTAQSMESFVYGEMVEKMRKYHTLKGGKEQGYNPKLTAARVALAKTESEIEKLLDTLSGANPLLLQYANNRIEELDTERQKQLKLVADLTANSVSDTQIDCITNYLNDWESVSFDDKRKVVDILISHIDATSESVTIHWKI